MKLRARVRSRDLIEGEPVQKGVLVKQGHTRLLGMWAIY